MQTGFISLFFKMNLGHAIISGDPSELGIISFVVCLFICFVLLNNHFICVVIAFISILQCRLMTWGGPEAKKFYGGP